ncbi:porin [Mucilaginibacter sp. JRF]|uniref:porin n=1 Tax=Mucilaginibacter sp. JRF TaxID=2780088 RepID=UPI001882AD2B|nr:porin [Mucilaginibacter sp. JRF]MBE9586254.1 porin [Mucilaginibacter sp. JRF]
MKRKLLLLSLLTAGAFVANAQDSTQTDPPLTITGSVDTYYKYDFADHANLPTSFASDHNSMSIGMIDIALKKKVSKAAFVGEISFGPRGQEQSLVPGASGDSYHIQNLYVSYDITDKFVVTGGYMSTFIGYEVISPVGNFNYSTSYMFTNGPFQNAGLKFAYTFTDKVSLMAGVFNDAWNSYNTISKMNNFGAQLALTPVEGWSAYLNVLTGKTSGTEFDLTTAYQITDAFKLGLNAADYSAADDAGGFTGVALYPQLAVSKSVTFGLRGEYFKTKSGVLETFGPAPGESVVAITATANIKAGPLNFIPEVRLDNMSNDAVFTKKSGAPSKSAGQFVLAAVYAF